MWVSVLLYSDANSRVKTDNDDNRNDNDSEGTNQTNVSLKRNDNQDLHIDAQRIYSAEQDKDLYKGNITNISETDPMIGSLHSLPGFETVSPSAV